MKKEKITKKQIMNGFKNIISCGYCEIQSLLQYKEANYYTTGTYGWNSDIYIINKDTAIVTGYRPFGNIRNYDVSKKYEEEARKILCNSNLKWEKQHEKINELFKKYIDEILKIKEV